MEENVEEVIEIGSGWGQTLNLQRVTSYSQLECLTHYVAEALR